MQVFAKCTEIGVLFIVVCSRFNTRNSNFEANFRSMECLRGWIFPMLYFRTPMSSGLILLLEATMKSCIKETVVN